MSKIYLVKLESGEYSLYETYKEVKIGSTISVGKGFFKIISEIETDVHGKNIKLEYRHLNK
jgi:hypothetical protein